MRGAAPRICDPPMGLKIRTILHIYNRKIMILGNVEENAMYRFLLELYCGPAMIFSKEFTSITKVAKFIDCFDFGDYEDFWFELTDTVKDTSISVKELMTIWHQ